MGPGSVVSRLAQRVSDDRDEAHAPAGRTAQVVSQPELRVLDLPGAGFAAELQPHLVHHAQPRGADRMTERLQAAVGIHRLGALEVEAPFLLVLPGLAAR